MFTYIGRAVSRRPVVFVVAWALLLSAMACLAFQGLGHGGLFERLTSTNAPTPDTESEQVSSLTDSDGTDGETVTVVVEGVDVHADPAGLAAAVSTARSTLSGLEDVASVQDAFSMPDPASQQARALLSADGDGYVELVTLAAGLDDDRSQAANDRVAETAEGAYLDALRQHAPDANAHAVSTELIGDSIGRLVQEDLAQGESVSLPIALVLLILVFGGLLAAGLPLVNAIVSILVGMGALWCLTFVLDVHSFILNVISILGLALSIDYGLLFVSRYREELANELAESGDGGGEPPVGEAMKDLVRRCVVRTVATAGRTVSFSALTIACSIAGLLVLRTPMFKTIAAGAAIVALLAVLGTVTLVPSIITLLGSHLVRPSPLSRVPGIRRVMRAIGDSSSDHGFFSRLSRRVVAHPWIIMVVIAIALSIMASPVASLHMRTNIVEYMPANSSVRTGYDIVQDDYPALATPTISVVAQTDTTGAAGLVSDIRAMDDVTHVTAAPLPGHEDMTLISVL
ncbi:MMPL family transporter, partial [Propionibacterium acidifaciens]|uniref:MMPL family transporter n=1 Tax=Propionibacterium acidifaciens TaxID=556499 RepID=UPI003614408B